MGKWAQLLVFLVLTVGGGSLIGTLTAPGDWFRALEKPAFNPPDWVFAPVWTVLYVLIAVAGWRLFRRARRSAAFAAWGVQLVLNFLWSPVFFAAHSIALALAVVAALLVAVVVTIALSWRLDRPSALMLVPYALWVGFATLLNGAILALN